MDNPMNINTNIYEVGASTSSAAATLIQEDWPLTRVIVYNDADVPVFVVSGETEPTAVFPTSASVPLSGSVISSKSTQTFYKKPGHKFISAILSTGTGSVFFKLGTGE